MLKNTHMHIFFGAEKPTHIVRTYLYVKYMEYPPRVLGKCACLFLDKISVRTARSCVYGRNIYQLKIITSRFNHFN